MSDDIAKPVTPETFAAQAGGGVDVETGAIVAPIHVTTTYERGADLAYPKGYVYARPDNATVRQAEAVITRLEHGAETLLVPSGMAAAVSLFLALDKPAHVIAPTVMYWSLRNWLATEGARYGIEATFIDTTDTDLVARTVRPGETKLIWIETPGNPLWQISDIAAIAAIANWAGGLLAVDSTCATPVLTNPLKLGADIVMHSATKYLNGHSDVMAGSLTFADPTSPLFEATSRLRGQHGTILGPFEAALLMRGLRTLHVRVAHQCRSAMAVAKAMSSDSRVADVLYPGLKTTPGHALAARQMTGGFGGMLSIRVRGGEAAAIAAAARLRVWKRATSLGGVESLVEHRASVEGAGTPCPPDLLRLSVGLETADDLIADLQQALVGNG
ncbi:MAG: PLP-dependent transferase [Alphaproteobacteria bacterium]|nr:PLP-dependent transferase [Alphaproteobacteria bacterium]